MGRPVRRSGRVSRSLAAARIAGAIAVGKVRSVLASRLVSRERRDEVVARAELRTAEQVAETLGEMKGALMKLGQLASFLDEGMPEHVRTALASLQSDAPPMAPELAESVVEEELGAPPHRLFARFERTPLAAASIGQVHRAVTKDGRTVAVKVQYPGVGDAIRSDLANTAMLSRLMPVMFPSFDATAFSEELSARLVEELDYRIEADNQRAFAEVYRDHPFIHIPEIVDELSTGRVLTSELATGARFEEVVGWPKKERDLAGETLFRFVFRGINRTGMFNGDPHPGNYLFHRGGRVTFLDFGLVKHFTPEETGVFHRLIQTMVLDRDAAGYRRELEQVGLLRPGSELTDDEVTAYFGHFYDLVAEPGARTVEQEYASETVRRIMNPDPRIVKDISLPTMFVIVQRINLGLYALLARLRATADWRAIGEELWPMTNAPPATHLGRLETEWIARTGRGADRT